LDGPEDNGHRLGAGSFIVRVTVAGRSERQIIHLTD
jgi:hypothetical protein